MPKKKKNLNYIKVGKLLKQQALNNETINISKAMREVGYAKTTVNSKAGTVVKSKEVQDELASFINDLDGLVEDNIKHMRKKQASATFRDANEAVKSLSQLRNLIQGKPTSSVMVVKWDDNEK